MKFKRGICSLDRNGHVSRWNNEFLLKKICSFERKWLAILILRRESEPSRLIRNKRGKRTGLWVAGEVESNGEQWARGVRRALRRRGWVPPFRYATGARVTAVMRQRMWLCWGAGGGPLAAPDSDCATAAQIRKDLWIRRMLRYDLAEWALDRRECTGGFRRASVGDASPLPCLAAGASNLCPKNGNHLNLPWRTWIEQIWTTMIQKTWKLNRRTWNLNLKNLKLEFKSLNLNLKIEWKKLKLNSSYFKLLSKRLEK